MKSEKRENQRLAESIEKLEEEVDSRDAILGIRRNYSLRHEFFFFSS
jgi:hypothetical protein